MYIGKTKWSFQVRLKEYVQNQNGNIKRSAIVSHCWYNDYIYIFMKVQ